MKRIIKNVPTLEFELNIDIVSSAFSNVVSGTDIDFSGSEYDNFIVGLISQFLIAGFKKLEDEDYTHDSNYGSLSTYITFTKLVDDIRVVVVVNLRLSDHPDRSIRGMTPQAKRAKYVAEISNQIGQQEDADPLPYPLDIVFDDKHFRSYQSATFYIHDQIKKIESEVSDYIASK